MKKNYIYILFAVFVSVIFSGCNIEPTLVELDSPSPSQNGFNEINNNSYRLLRMCDESDRYGKLYELEEKIQDNFNIEIELMYLESDLLEALKQAANSTGMVYFRDRYTLNKFIEAGLLVPLDEYIDDLEYQNEHFYSLSNGEGIYSIPVSAIGREESRFFSDEVYNIIGENVIDTIDKLYNTGMLYTEKNIGKDNFKPFMGIYRNAFNNELYDIQHSFGCYFNSFPSEHGNMITSIAFNPNINKYEDCAISDGIIDYLSFMKKLVDQNILVIEENQIPTVEKQYASFWESVLSYMDYPGYKLGSNYLYGTNIENLYEKKYFYMSYGFLKGTENIEGYISKFYDEFMNDQQFILSFFAGIQDIDYEIFDDFGVTYKLQGEAPEFVVPTNRALLISEIPIDRDNEDYIESYNHSKNTLPKYKEYCEKIGIQNNYVLNYATSAERLLQEVEYDTAALIDFNEIVLFPVLNGEIGIEEAIDKYITLANQKGLNQIIERLNNTN